MSSKDQSSTPKDGEKKLKPCCACPETRQPRDTWYASSFVACFYSENRARYLTIAVEINCWISFECTFDQVVCHIAL